MIPSQVSTLLSRAWEPVCLRSAEGVEEDDRAECRKLSLGEFLFLGYCFLYFMPFIVFLYGKQKSNFGLATKEPHLASKPLPSPPSAARGDGDRLCLWAGESSSDGRALGGSWRGKDADSGLPGRPQGKGGNLVLGLRYRGGEERAGWPACPPIRVAGKMAPGVQRLSVPDVKTMG